MAQMLFDAGASVDSVNVTYGTTFRAADVHGKLALEFRTRDIEANVHMADEDRMNALRFAASMGRVTEMQYLLDSGLQVDSKDKRGWSAIHHAALARISDCLELLPSWLTLDTNGGTSLHLACRGNQPTAIGLFFNVDLEATPIMAENSVRRCALLDTVKWHENWSLIFPAAYILHKALE